jgi:MoaA/NifB/PqqE/SkfB family radical SAM enzyme
MTVQAPNQCPEHIRLEVSSRCQLRCPGCPTGRGENRQGVVGWGFLTLANFQRFTALNERVRFIELSNWGEVFLNPEFVGILEHAALSGIRCSLRNGVNLNHATDAQLEAVVRCGIADVTVSIDGITEESYSRYRQGGSVERVLRNLRKLLEYRVAMNRQTPRIRWQFIAFGHNEHEIDVASQLADTLGVEFVVKLNSFADYSPVVDHERLRRFTGGATTRKEYKQITGKPYSLPCTQLETMPQINWDGTLLGCCVNVYAGFGDAFTHPLADLLESNDYRHALDVVAGRVAASETCPCSRCPIYHREIARRPPPLNTQ